VLFSGTIRTEIVDPYHHSYDGGQVGLVADFVADAPPTDAFVGWGDGELRKLIVDYSPVEKRGRAYAIHSYDYARGR